MQRIDIEGTRLKVNEIPLSSNEVHPLGSGGRRAVPGNTFFKEKIGWLEKMLGKDPNAHLRGSQVEDQEQALRRLKIRGTDNEDPDKARKKAQELSYFEIIFVNV